MIRILFYISIFLCLPYSYIAQTTVDSASNISNNITNISFVSDNSISGKSKPISIRIGKEIEFQIDQQDKLKKSEDTKVNYAINYNKYYALIIGIEDYQYFNKLNKPIDDALKVKTVLTSKYSFDKENVFLLKNPSRSDILDYLDLLSSKITANDNLLIFYAGHGVWDEKNGMGYWLPVNAKKDRRSDWISNSTLVDYLSSIESKHTLLISDACFSGGIFKTRNAQFDNFNANNNLYRYKSRKAITSGTLTTVPDNSVFTKYLVQRLTQNNKNYLSTEALFSSLKIAVINNSSNIPQYGVVKNAGDEGGDFIFILKGIKKTNSALYKKEPKKGENINFRGSK